LADLLLRRKAYKEQMDDMLCQYVFPEFASPRGHMRARVSVQYTVNMAVIEAVRDMTQCGIDCVTSS